jgi:hypothetical protein
VTRIITYLKQNALAAVALFVALGGTGYAAVTLPRNSVGTRQLRHGAVTLHKIKRGTLGQRILFTAEVSGFGRVLSSSPRGANAKAWDSDPTRLPDGGIITWHRAIPKDCSAFANAVGAPEASGDPPYADAVIGTGSAAVANVQVGMPSPAQVNVMVVCPTP